MVELSKSFYLYVLSDEAVSIVIAKASLLESGLF